MNQQNISYNEDGFPIDENGNFVQQTDLQYHYGSDEFYLIYDDEGNCRVNVRGETKEFLCPSDEHQIKETSKEISKMLSEGFSYRIRNIDLNKPKDCDDIATIQDFIFLTDIVLNGLGEVWGLNFEYLTYLSFKNDTNSFLNRINHYENNYNELDKNKRFVKKWYKEKDKIYLQKRETYLSLEPEKTESEKNKSVNYKDLSLYDFLDEITSDKCQLTNVEIYNYFDNITSNFDIVKVKTILFDLDVYYNLEFKERLNIESQEIYLKEGWEIPEKEVKISFLKNDEKHKFPDYDEMRKKTHPFDSLNIVYAIGLLKNKLQSEKNPSSNKTTSTESVNHPGTPEVNPYPRIFTTPRSYKIFEYLKENLVREQYQLADYSFIFRHMQKDEYIFKDIAESAFRDHLLQEYQIDLEKLKTESYCETDLKFNIYSTAKNQIK